MNNPLDIISSTAMSTVTAPIQAMVNQQIAIVASQVRTKIAADNGVDPSQVTDLMVAEYMIGMPMASTNTVLDNEIRYIGKAAFFGIVTAGALIATAIVMTGNRN